MHSKLVRVPQKSILYNHPLKTTIQIYFRMKLLLNEIKVSRVSGEIFPRSPSPGGRFKEQRRTGLDFKIILFSLFFRQPVFKPATIIFVKRALIVYYKESFRISRCSEEVFIAKKGAELSQISLFYKPAKNWLLVSGTLRVVLCVQI